jgi:hypothetical protein
MREKTPNERKWEKKTPNERKWEKKPQMRENERKKPQMEKNPKWKRAGKKNIPRKSSFARIPKAPIVPRIITHGPFRKEKHE